MALYRNLKSILTANQDVLNRNKEQQKSGDSSENTAISIFIGCNYRRFVLI